MDCTDNGLRRPGTLAAPRRNHYYYTKLLDVLHFEMEQAYGIRQRWLLNRLSEVRTGAESRRGAPPVPTAPSGTAASAGRWPRHPR
jgi:hypothetical protein